MALPEHTLEALTNGQKNMSFDDEGQLTSASGSGVDLYVLVSLVSWIKLELKTGMKMTRHGSTLRKANEMLGTNYKRKQQALDHLEALLSLLKTEDTDEL
jgi:hypothetical protein